MGAWLKPNLGRRDRRSDSLAALGTAPVFDAFCGCQPSFMTHCLFAQHRGPLPTAAESVGFLWANCAAPAVASAATQLKTGGFAGGFSMLAEGQKSRGNHRDEFWAFLTLIGLTTKRRIWAPGSIRTENAVQQATAKLSNSAMACLSSVRLDCYSACNIALLHIVPSRGQPGIPVARINARSLAAAVPAAVCP
jgi:hypothetical protein